MSTDKVGIVGPCAAGKSTLVSALSKLGYEAKHIAQDHSYVADMWQRLTKPRVLIYLSASYSTTITRRNINWTQNEYNEQLRRLGHARDHADLILETDDLTPDEVLQSVLRFLHTFGITPVKSSM
jgi:cytidylate kinase